MRTVGKEGHPTLPDPTYPPADKLRTGGSDDEA